jgi:hypothetical protein
MRVQQIAGALTLSVALAGIGLITAAAPTSAAKDASSSPAATAPGSTAAGFGPGASPPVVKSRVKINSIREKGADAWLVEGVVRSPVKGCERRRLVTLTTARRPEHGVRDKDRTDRRGRFTIYGTGIRRGASVWATSALSKPNRRRTCKVDEKRL